MILGEGVAVCLLLSAHRAVIFATAQPSCLFRYVVIIASSDLFGCFFLRNFTENNASILESVGINFYMKVLGTSVRRRKQFCSLTDTRCTV